VMKDLLNGVVLDQPGQGRRPVLADANHPQHLRPQRTAGRSRSSPAASPALWSRYPRQYASRERNRQQGRQKGHRLAHGSAHQSPSAPCPKPRDHAPEHPTPLRGIAIEPLPTLIPGHARGDRAGIQAALEGLQRTPGWASRTCGTQAAVPYGSGDRSSALGMQDPDCAWTNSIQDPCGVTHSSREAR